MLNTQQINEGLQIVKLNGQKFPTKGGYYKPDGHTLFHPELGYFSFDSDYPYIPSGGRKALKSILEAGGMTDYDNCNWLQTI